MTKLRKIQAIGLAVAVAAAGAAGCGSEDTHSDPKPVNVKNDPRLKRMTQGASGGANQNATGAKVPVK